MKYCIHCGKEMNDVAEFCPYCGEKVKNQQDTNNIVSKGSDIPQTSIPFQVSQGKEILEKKHIAPTKRKTKKLYFLFSVYVLLSFL